MPPSYQDENVVVDLVAGAVGHASLVVTEADTAAALGSGDVPVLGTPRLLALCEEATVAAVGALLQADQTSVGTRVELEHLRPSAPGAEVTATATLEAVTGKRLRFTVEAVEDGQVVGRGTVERAVVARDRFGVTPRTSTGGTPPPGR
jgi:predicted thioesterase